MNVFPLFNIAVPNANAHSAAAQRFGAENVGGATDHAATTASVGAFVTPQTLVTFTGATGVIASVHASIAAMVTIPHPFDVYVVAVLSMIVGALIYWISEADPRAPRMETRQRVTSIVIAGLNTAILFNASRAILAL